ncbi:MAG: ABC transporter ATP-binding protein [Candidatus Thorarchaeota archaeon]
MISEAVSAIKIRNVFKNFGQKTVLKDVTFDVPRGVIHGLIGHNGAGKTTLFRIILGLLKASDGKIEIFGTELSDQPYSKTQLGYVGENLGLYSSLSVRDNLIRFCRLYDITDCTSLVEEIIVQLDLVEYRDTAIRKLSAGTKQRVAIARGMMGKPQLIILDEFLQNIDPTWRHRLKEILINQRNNGVTSLISTHILGDVEELCDYVTLIKEGEILFTGRIVGLYEKLKRKTISVKMSTSDNAKAYRVLDAYDVAEVDDALLVTVDSREDIPRMTQMLLAKGLMLYETRIEKDSLETIYAKLHSSE